MGAIVIVGGLLLAVAVVALAVVVSQRPRQALALIPLKPIDLAEGQPLNVKLAIEATGMRRDEVRFALGAAPDGTTLDPNSGILSWTPDEEDGPREHTIVVRATGRGIKTEQTYRVAVREQNTPPEVTAPADQRIAPGQEVRLQIEVRDADLPAQTLSFALIEGAAVGASIDEATGRFVWKSASAQPGKEYRFKVRVRDSGPGSTSIDVAFRVLVAADDQPLATIERPAALAPAEPAAEGAPASSIPDVASPSDSGLAGTDSPESAPTPLVALFDEGMLFHPKSYARLRHIFTERFEQQFDEQIKQAFADDNDALRAWHDKHVDLKEEFFLALDPRCDDVPAALALWCELWKKHDDRLAVYGQLGIATAVVWDRDNGGIIDLNWMADYAKAKVPDGKLGALENFQYLVDAEPVMEGRILYVPWEFLVHVVNHKTPLAERRWAVQNYVNKRVMFGKCYHDVPYDYDMLNSDGKTTHLVGQLYTLPNIRQFGGVCMYQADFAGRVGKSLGVPAAAVTGDGRYGEGHAWVMWVELLQVAANTVQFRLESHGRYRGDHYYTGNLTDPRTGQQITDRELELRLHSVGRNAVGKRHAALAMAAFAELRDREPAMDPAAQLRYLAEVIKLNPGNEEAWIAAGQLGRASAGDKGYAKAFRTVLDSLFTTFAAYPDFTWKVFDDLVAFSNDHKVRNGYYERIVAMYEEAKRPDLAAEARLKLTDYLVEDGRQMDAIEGLAYTINRFPDEGQFVPKLLDRLDALCAQVEGAQSKLVAFYLEILPRIPKMRDSRPSEYCLNFYSRAIGVVERAGMTDVAAQLRQEQEQIRAGKARK